MAEIMQCQRKAAEQRKAARNSSGGRNYLVMFFVCLSIYFIGAVINHGNPGSMAATEAARNDAVFSSPAAEAIEQALECARLSHHGRVNSACVRKPA